MNDRELATTTEALEELRMADDQLLNAIGDIQGQQVGGVLDTVGVNWLTGSDSIHAQEDLQLARRSIERALELLGMHRDGVSDLLREFGPERWDIHAIYAFLEKDEIWDPAPEDVFIRRARSNLSVVRQTRDDVRALFTQIRGADPTLELRSKALMASAENKNQGVVGHFVGMAPRHWSGKQAAVAVLLGLIVIGVIWFVMQVSF